MKQIFESGSIVNSYINDKVGRPFKKGEIGRAVRFNGSTDYVRIPHVGIHPNQYPISIAFWAKFDKNTTGSESGRCVASCGTWGGGDAIYIGIDDSGDINNNSNLILAFFNVSWRVLDTGLQPAIGKWYRVFITITSAGAEIFLNGTSYGTMPYVPPSNINTCEWLLGERHAAAYPSAFAGTLFDFSVYNSKKTLVEINAYDYSNAVGWWKLNETNSNGRAIDSHSTVFSEIKTGDWTIANDTYSFITQNIVNLDDNGLGRDVIQDACITLNGTNDYGIYNGQISTSSTGTFECLVSVGNLDAVEKHIISVGGDGTQRFALFTSGNTTNVRFAFAIGDGAGTTNKGYTDYAYDANTWYKIRLTSNGSRYKLFVDDVDTSFSITEGSDNGDWLDGISNTNPKTMIGGLRYSAITYIRYVGSIAYIKYWEDERLYIKDCCEGYGIKAWWKLNEADGNIAYDSSGNNYHMNLVYASLANLWANTQSFFSVSDKIGYGKGLQILTDGDMENSGVSDWSTSLGTASKESDTLNGGTQCIRSTANAGAGVKNVQLTQQIFVIGVDYRVRGYARSNGTQTPVVFIGGVLSWTGTTSTEWQYFDVTATTTNAFLSLYFQVTDPAGSEYVEFNDVKVEAVDIRYPISTVGPELVTNGEFNTDTTGWTSDAPATITWQSDGTLRIDRNSAGTTNQCYQTIATEVGKAYILEVDVIETGVGFGVSVAGSLKIDIERQILNKKLKVTFVATSTSTEIQFNVLWSTTSYAIIDNVTVREMNVPNESPNIFINGNAEYDDTTMFTSGDGAILNRIADENSDGYFWRLISDGASTNNAYFGMTIGSGKRIRLRCKVRTDGISVAHTANIWTFGAGGEKAITSSYSGDNWYHYDETFTTAHSLGVVFRVATPLNSNGYAEYKDIIIEDLDQSLVNGHKCIISSPDDQCYYTEIHGGRAKYNMLLTDSNCLDINTGSYVNIPASSTNQVYMKCSHVPDNVTGINVMLQKYLGGGTRVALYNNAGTVRIYGTGVGSTFDQATGFTMSAGNVYNFELRLSENLAEIWMNGEYESYTPTIDEDLLLTLTYWQIGHDGGGGNQSEGKYWDINFDNLCILPCAEGAGKFIYDVSGNENHGSASAGSLVWTTQDEYHYNALEGHRRSMYFNGSSTKHSGENFFAGENNVRIIARFKTGSDVTTLQYAIGEVYTVSNGISITASVIRCYLNIGGASKQLDFACVANTEYLVDMSYNESTGIFSTTVNGSTQTINSLSGSVGDSVSYFSLGGYTTTALAVGQHFTGMIHSTLVYVDGVEVWNGLTEGSWIGTSVEPYLPLVVWDDIDNLDAYRKLGGKGFNSCETLISLPEASELIQADIDDELLFSSGTAQTLDATDFEDIIPSKLLKFNTDNSNRNIVSIFDSNMLVDTNILTARGAGGSGGAIECGDILDMGTSDLIMEWYMIIPTGYTPVDYEAIIGKGYAGLDTGRYYVGMDSSSNLFLVFEPQAGVYPTIAASMATLSKDVPLLCRAIFNRSGHMKMLVNGEVFGTPVDISAYSSDSLNTASQFCIIGQDNGGTRFSSRIKIWDAKIWIDDVLEGHWPLDGNTYDVSGNGYHGTWNVDVPEYPALTDDEVKNIDQESYTRAYGHSIGDNIILNPSDLTQASWVRRGTCVATYNQADPTGGTNATKLTGIYSIGSGDCYQTITGLSSKKGSYKLSFWLKPVTILGTLYIASPYTISNGRWTIDKTKLTFNEWNFIDENHPAVTVDYQFSLSLAANIGVHFYSVGSTADEIHIYNCKLEEQFIPAAPRTEFVTGDNSTFDTGIGSWGSERSGVIAHNATDLTLRVTPQTQSYSGCKLILSGLNLNDFVDIEFKCRVVAGTPIELELRNPAALNVYKCTPTTEWKTYKFESLKATTSTNLIFCVANGVIPDGSFIFELDNVKVTLNQDVVAGELTNPARNGQVNSSASHFNENANEIKKQLEYNKNN